jgi:hypothetical protein
MKKHLELPIVLGLSAGILIGEMSAESLPHAEFVAVSPTPMMNIAVSNATAVTVSSSDFDSYATAEQRIPHDHLVVYATERVLPVGDKR